MVEPLMLRPEQLIRLFGTATPLSAKVAVARLQPPAGEAMLCNQIVELDARYRYLRHRPLVGEIAGLPWFRGTMIVARSGEVSLK